MTADAGSAAVVVPSELDEDEVATAIVFWLADHRYVEGVEVLALLADRDRLLAWLEQESTRTLAPPYHHVFTGRPSATVGYGNTVGNRRRKEQHADLVVRITALADALEVIEAVRNPGRPCTRHLLRWWTGTTREQALDLPSIWDATVDEVFRELHALGKRLPPIPIGPPVPPPPTIPLWR